MGNELTIEKYAEKYGCVRTEIEMTVVVTDEGNPEHVETITIKAIRREAGPLSQIKIAEESKEAFADLFGDDQASIIDAMKALSRDLDDMAQTESD